MSESQLSYGDLILEWEGNASVFDSVDSVDEPEPGKMQVRILVKRRTTLLDMIGRFALAHKLLTTFSETPAGKVLLAYCIIVLVNPFKIKCLKGVGIDPLIDSAAYDDETGELYVLKRDFLIYCQDNDIASELLKWLEDNSFIYCDSERVIFRNNFKRGNIISRA